MPEPEDTWRKLRTRNPSPSGLTTDDGRGRRRIRPKPVDGSFGDLSALATVSAGLLEAEPLDWAAKEALPSLDLTRPKIADGVGDLDRGIDQGKLPALALLLLIVDATTGGLSDGSWESAPEVAGVDALGVDRDVDSVGADVGGGEAFPLLGAAEIAAGGSGSGRDRSAG